LNPPTPGMARIGITGGIASGKSTFAGLLAKALQCPLLSADAIVHDLIAQDPEVHGEILKKFGEGVLNFDESISREKLRSLVFADSFKRLELEGILHPRVRTAWLMRSSSHHGLDSLPILIEIPLLFETHAEAGFEFIVTVACSPEEQMRRLQSHRRLSQELSKSIIQSQISNTTRINGSHFMVWNDGSSHTLAAQVSLVAYSIQSHLCLKS